MSVNLSVEAAAEIAHTIVSEIRTTLWQDPLKPWADCDEGDRKSSIESILGSETAEQSHDRWSQEAKRNGWRWGEKKDPVAKTSPALVPYDELPPGEKAKDAVFVALAAIVRGDRK